MDFTLVIICLTIALFGLLVAMIITANSYLRAERLLWAKENADKMSQTVHSVAVEDELKEAA